MLDIGWSELVLIGIVALIFVGPKDLPRMFHALGRFTAKARSMAREFQRAMDDAAKASGLDEMKKDLNGLNTGLKAATNPAGFGINALEDAARKFENWDPKSVLKPATPAAPATATAAAAEPSAATTEPAAELGPETKALAEKRAAEAAAARAKAHELQAKAAASASATFAARAKADAEAAAAKAAAATPASLPEATPPEAAEPAAPKPARKPPVRHKKNDA